MTEYEKRTRLKSVMAKCEVCKLITNGYLSLIGLFFIVIGCLLPEEWLISLIFLITGSVLFWAWAVLCIVIVLKGCTLSDLWYGFLNYLAETFAILKMLAIVFVIMGFIALAFMRENVPA